MNELRCPYLSLLGNDRFYFFFNLNKKNPHLNAYYIILRKMKNISLALTLTTLLEL